jgi:hypothetical protein
MVIGKQRLGLQQLALCLNSTGQHCPTAHPPILLEIEVNTDRIGNVSERSCSWYINAIFFAI